MLGLARALAPAAQPRLGRAAFPLLQRCRSYCQAQPESDSYSSSSKPRREVFVDNADDLDEVLESCDRSEYLAIDTEFVAFPSLVPKLQLVQVGTPDMLAVIDYRGVKSEGLMRFAKIMQQKTVIAHSAATDIRLLGHVTGCLPKALFDTQVASDFVGMGPHLSLADMVRTLIGVELDKSLTMNDWNFRPLSKAMIKYAMDDVKYLLEIRDILEQKLVSRGRYDWFLEEMAPHSTYEHYQPEPAGDLWRHCRKPHRLEGMGLAVLRELFVWRDEAARRDNLQHHLVMRDECCVILAIQQPSRLVELTQIQVLPKKTFENHGMEILRRIKKGQATPESDWPTQAEFDRNFDHFEACLAYLMQAVIRQTSDDTDIAGSLFYDKPYELKPLVMTPVENWDTLNHPLFRGWRRELVGNHLSALKKGEKYLVYNEKEQRVDILDRPET